MVNVGHIVVQITNVMELSLLPVVIVFQVIPMLVVDALIKEKIVITEHAVTK
jgi:hypothetical protein